MKQSYKHGKRIHMNYIVVDLEWNQSPQGKKYEIKEIPFEIIEIGAVKLDNERNIVSEFERVVKPQLYKELHFKTQEIITIDMEELQRGDKFFDVVNDFLKWCGEDYIFCTWGSTDLIELQRNMHFYKVDIPYEMPLKFYDIQKFFSILYEDGKSRTALQTAAEFLSIVDGEFHRAINDARYTAKIIQCIDFERASKNYSIDYYTIPYKRSNEIFINYETYHKYISRGFRQKESLMSDKEVLSSRCYLCGKECESVVPWFSTNTKIYFGLFNCEEHGYMKGKIRAKYADNGKYFAVKILKLTDEDGVKQIYDRQETTREKRKLKRHKEDEN